MHSKNVSFGEHWVLSYIRHWINMDSRPGPSHSNIDNLLSTSDHLTNNSDFTSKYECVICKRNFDLRLINFIFIDINHMKCILIYICDSCLSGLALALWIRPTPCYCILSTSIMDNLDYQHATYHYNKNIVCRICNQHVLYTEKSIQCLVS